MYAVLSVKRTLSQTMKKTGLDQHYFCFIHCDSRYRCAVLYVGVECRKQRQQQRQQQQRHSSNNGPTDQKRTTSARSGRAHQSPPAAAVQRSVLGVTQSRRVYDTRVRTWHDTCIVYVCMYACRHVRGHI